MARAPDQDYRASVFREVMVEHLLVGELLRLFWNRGLIDVEILRSEFDAGGYDLVVSHRDLTRHVQLKTRKHGARTRSFDISLNLARKPGGCVVVVDLTPEMEFARFLWFGGPPGEPLPGIDQFRISRHTKGNKDGVKLERSNLRTVPIREFEPVADVVALGAKLLGKDALS